MEKILGIISIIYNKQLLNSLVIGDLIGLKIPLVGDSDNFFNFLDPRFGEYCTNPGNNTLKCKSLDIAFVEPFTMTHQIDVLLL